MGFVMNLGVVVRGVNQSKNSWCRDQRPVGGQGRSE